MFPLRDRNPSGTFPYCVLLIIVANAAVGFWEWKLFQHGGKDAMKSLIYAYGCVPAETIKAWKTLDLVNPHIGLTTLTSMFMHGGILHLLGNMWFLIVFGDNVEDHFGHGMFLVFYVVCGVGADVAHMAAYPDSALPCIGASGAVSGVLGAYILLYPSAKILTTIPIFPWFINVSAYFFIFVWFLINFVSGSLALKLPVPTGVAFWAHVGGFAAGLLLAVLLPKSEQSRQSDYSGSRFRRESRPWRSDWKR